MWKSFSKLLKSWAKTLQTHLRGKFKEHLIIMNHRLCSNSSANMLSKVCMKLKLPESKCVCAGAAVRVCIQDWSTGYLWNKTRKRRFQTPNWNSPRLGEAYKEDINLDPENRHNLSDAVTKKTIEMFESWISDARAVISVCAAVMRRRKCPIKSTLRRVANRGIRRYRLISVKNLTV